AVSPRASGPPRHRVGHLRQQPQSQVLSPHGGRPAASARRNGSVASHGARDEHGARRPGGVMPLWARLRSFRRSVFNRSEMERNMSDELDFHLARRADDLIAERGLAPDEARRIARLEFGSVEKYKEEARESLGLTGVDDVRGDLRYAFRS